MKRTRIFSGILFAICINLVPTIAEWNESTALAVLASDTEKKAQACQALAVVGGPESVPALAALLDDVQLASYARTALEVIDHPSAGQALRDALPTVSGRLLAGVVTSLGVRGDVEAIPDLQELANDSDLAAAKVALAALGRIGTEESLATVIKSINQGSASLRIAAAHSALAAAEERMKQGNQKAAQKLLDSVSEAVLPDYIKQAAVSLRRN